MVEDIIRLKAKPFLKGLKFPEGLRWRDKKLWFSDMDDHKVKTIDIDGNLETIIELQNRPSGLGWLPNGKLLIVSMEDRKLLRLDPDGLQIVSDLSDLVDFDLNDMVVDKNGRAYIGNFGFDFRNNTDDFSPADLFLVTPEGKTQVVANNLAFPNGCVITPDGRTLVISESWASRLTAFDINDDGTLSNRRIWAKMDNLNPDGICLDTEGGIWVAAPGSKSVVRILEGGKITNIVTVDPTQDAYCCMLGGPDGKTLFIATASPMGSTKIEGRIEKIQVDIAGESFP